jgi:hypothetical protein
LIDLYRLLGLLSNVWGNGNVLCKDNHYSWIRNSCLANTDNFIDTLICDQVCQWLAANRWFSQDSSTNKTDRHDITEILLKVELNTINQTFKTSNHRLILATVITLLYYIINIYDFVLTNYNNLFNWAIGRKIQGTIQVVQISNNICSEQTTTVNF